MRASTYLQAVLGASLVAAAPTPGAAANGNGAPPGWNGSVENYCNAPFVLYCCKMAIAGAAGTADGTASGCVSAMVGGQVTIEYGFCPNEYIPRCCSVSAPVVGVETGCALPTQVQQ